VVSITTFGAPAARRSRAAADTTFVLDRLERARRWNRLIDGSRIAMVGHSAGGQSAAHLLPVNDRIKAAVNLDGSYNPVTPAEPVTKPFMMIGNPRQQPVTSTRELRRLRGARAAARHAGVSDRR
jgi:dienelactone hydrolase